jgi:predicted nucleic acid-binding protein
MDIKPIPGFHALAFKDECQARVQAELHGLSPEERVAKLNNTAGNVPVGDLRDQQSEIAPEVSKLRVYVDTSVVGGCFEEEFAEWSNALFQKARDGEVVILVSSVLIDELTRSPERVRAVIDDLPKHAKAVIPQSEEIERLHALYIAYKVVGPASANDARHVASATVAKANVLVSWNMSHLVHYDKIWKYNAVNQIENYQRIEIRTPQEVV